MTMREEFLFLCHACTLPALAWIVLLHFESILWKAFIGVAIIGALFVSFVGSEYIALSSETGREHPIASSVAAAAIWLLLQAIVFVFAFIALGF